MTLLEALQDIQYSTSWGIWAEKIDGKFNIGSEARYGQQIFENGGLLDDWCYVCDGEFASDRFVIWQNGSGEVEWDDDFTDELIEELNSILD